MRRALSEVAAFQEQKRSLAAWSVAAAPASLDDAVLARLRVWREGGAREGGARTKTRASARQPAGRGWVWGGAGALAACVLAVVMVTSIGGRSARQTLAVNQNIPAPVPTVSSGEDGPVRAANMAQVAPPASESVGGISAKALQAPSAERKAASPASALANLDRETRRQIPALPSAVEAPMIARTVALTLTVKDVERSREGLENLLRAYGGYAAQMEVNTPDGGTRSLTASLRVPAGALRGMLAELKGYGKVETETQSGEEVGQQHADLAARLNTARASEERLRGILKTRTGDVSEVLEVEEQISTVREQIEQMEAEQQGLEHRVSYATVDLTLNEEGQGPAARTVGSRLAAGARAGWNNAVEAVLGLVTFVLEYGLATVLVLALLGLPAWWLWRRWRRVRKQW